MKLVTLSYAPLDASVNGYKTGATGASWPLTVTTAGDGLGHLTTIRNNSSTDHSGKTALVTGTDADGKAQTETITLPTGNATVTGAKHFGTVTTIVPSATIGADTMGLGWSAVAVSPVVPLNYVHTPFSVSLGIVLTGTINYTVQHVFNDIFAAAPSTYTWFPHITLVTSTSNGNSNYAFPVRATRLLVNSVTAGATIAFTINQGR